MRALRFFGVVLACGLLGAAPPRNATLYGYSLAGSERERRFESMFLDIPSAQGGLDAAGIIAARPHYAGSYGDQELAKYMRDKLREYGLEAELETLTARVDTPQRLALQILPTARPRGPAAPRAAGIVNFDLRETLAPAEEGSPGPVELPFNAGSPDGNVVGPLVYASAGREADYADLAKHDVEVRGAVVLIRYGAEFRGRLAARAQRHGAAGVIFYGDPADDGFARGAVYPNGPWRPAGSIERGTVGEGIGIPTLPISSTNAQTLLGSLRGPAGPRSWSGALNVAYPYARGPGVVRLTVQLNGAQPRSGTRSDGFAERMATRAWCSARTVTRGSTGSATTARGSSRCSSWRVVWATCCSRAGARCARSSSPAGTAKRSAAPARSPT